MNKQKTEECIDLLDETIQLEEEVEYREDTEEYRQSQIRIFDFGEIKDALKRLEAIEAQPDDDLVKEIMWINKNFGGSPNAKHKIRKLLQGRQPERLTVTRMQIKAIIISLHGMKKIETKMNYLTSLFKSKGIDVGEK